jgi:drug/metabolite transporter (DMT)-like permease
MWIIYSLLSALFAGYKQIFEKRIINKVPILNLCFYQTLLVSIFILPFAFINGLKISFNLLLILYIVSWFSVLSSILLYKAVKKNEISSTVPFLNLSPIFMIFIGYIFLKEIPNIIQIFGIIIIVIGAIALGMKKTDNFSRFFNKYVWYVIITALIWGTQGVIFRYIMSEIPPFTTLTYFNLFCLFNTFLIIIFTKKIHELKIKKMNLIFISSILSSCSLIFIFLALAHPLGLAALAVALRRTSTLVSTIIGGRFFKENNLKQKIFACLIMLIGVFIISIG